MRSDSSAARLLREVTRFESELGRLALEIVSLILTAELSRSPQQSSPLRRPGARRVQIAPRGSATVPTSRPSRVDGNKKSQWTRERVVSELGTWLLGGNADAAFVKRHGPPGLVAAAKRHFGRFEAALNAANLAISDQVAAKRRDRRQEAKALPTLRELAWQQQRRRRGARSGS